MTLEAYVGGVVVWLACVVIRCELAIDEVYRMTVKDTATLSSKFQISIPKAIGTARRWQAGQVFAFVPKGEGMMPVPTIEELAGLARGAGTEGYRDRDNCV